MIITCPRENIGKVIYNLGGNYKFKNSDNAIIVTVPDGSQLRNEILVAELKDETFVNRETIIDDSYRVIYYHNWVQNQFNALEWSRIAKYE